MYLKDFVPQEKRFIAHKLVYATVNEKGFMVQTENAMEKMQAQVALVQVAGPESKYKPGQVVVYNKHSGLDVTHLFQDQAHVTCVFNDSDVVCTATVGTLELLK